jgi:hypothetical protein
MKFENKVLKFDSDRIIKEDLNFEKGTVFGFSIEVFEPDTESYSSYTYYDDEKKRDKDYELLCELK